MFFKFNLGMSFNTNEKYLTAYAEYELKKLALSRNNMLS